MRVLEGDADGLDDRPVRWAEGKIAERVFAARALPVASPVTVRATRVSPLFLRGTEFMPKRDAGSTLIETKKLPGVALTDSV